jgi:thiamine biosynthesis protein ThiS
MRKLRSVKLILNGELRDIGSVATISALLAHLGLKADRVAVELNRDLVRRELWEATQLHEGDKLEIVQFVGGGSELLRQS